VADALQKGATPEARWLSPLAVPPVVGLMLIFLVAFNLDSSQITESPAGASTALVVGALLILGSAALYVLSPIRYDHFFTNLRERLDAGALGVRGQFSRAIEPTGGSPAIDQGGDARDPE